MRLAGGAVTFRDVLAVREFRVLWAAQIQSRVGDQLARVALAILVFDATRSPVWTAVTYALTLLPPLFSAPLLTPLADRYPRRTLMAVADLLRAALVAVIVLPGLPLPVLAALLVPMVALQPLFMAARNATLPVMLPGDRYMLGIGAIGVTDSIAQVGGFVFGGVAVGLLGPRPSLAVDAVTFLLSALLVRAGTAPHRPAALPDGDRPAGARSAVRLLRDDPRLRTLVLFVSLYGLYVVPEALAAPYAHQLHAGPAAVGVLMAADPVGAAVGAWAFTRLLGPAARSRWIGPLAVLSGLPLVASLAHPVLWFSVLMWALVGLLTTHVVLAQGLLTQLVPDGRRGSVVGLSSAALQTAQGAGMVLAGLLAQVTGPPVAIAACGAAGTGGALLLTVHRGRRPTTPVPGPAVRTEGGAMRTREG
jgi:MFS family permease